MVETKSPIRNLPVLLGIIVVIAVIVYLFYTGGLSFLQPGKQQVTYTSDKTVVENKDTGIEMSPTNGAVIHGLIMIKLTKAPANTAEVWFGMVPKSQYSDSTDTNLGFDSDGSNGWSLDFNTKDIVNGDYTVFIVPRDANKNPLSRIFVNVVVKN